MSFYVSLYKKIRKYGSSFAAAGVGILVSLLVLVVCAGRPVQAAADFFTGVFTSLYYAGSFLNTASLLMWAAVGAAVAIRSGSFNLGGEGQIYLGGFTAAVILGTPLLVPAAVHIVTAGTAAVIVGGFSSLIPALLKRFRGSSELLTSFLVSAVTIPLVDAAVAGPFRDDTRNLLATAVIPEQLRLPALFPPSPFNISFFAAVAFCLAGAVFLFRTKTGSRLCLAGSAPEFSRYAGYHPDAASFWGLCFSGCCHGMCGFFAVWGTYYTCHSGFYSGMGWNALSCALIAQSHPAAVIPSALLLSWIFTASSRASMVQSFSFDMAGLIQGAVLFCISARFAVLWHRGKRKLPV